MANNYALDKTQNWFSKEIQIGCCIAIDVKQLGAQHIELDSVDKIDLDNNRLHANKFGWFNINGEYCEDSYKHSEVISLRLLKPSKAIFTAACCGHKWDHKGKGQQRALSLRELLLSLSINWKTYR
jgi:hypothetical protein